MTLPTCRGGVCPRLVVVEVYTAVCRVERVCQYLSRTVKWWHVAVVSLVETNFKIVWNTRHYVKTRFITPILYTFRHRVLSAPHSLRARGECTLQLCSVNCLYKHLSIYLSICLSRTVAPRIHCFCVYVAPPCERRRNWLLWFSRFLTHFWRFFTNCNAYFLLLAVYLRAKFETYIV